MSSHKAPDTLIVRNLLSGLESLTAINDQIDYGDHTFDEENKLIRKREIVRAAMRFLVKGTNIVIF